MEKSCPTVAVPQSNCLASAAHGNQFFVRLPEETECTDIEGGQGLDQTGRASAGLGNLKPDSSSVEQDWPSTESHAKVRSRDSQSRSPVAASRPQAGKAEVVISQAVKMPISTVQTVINELDMAIAALGTTPKYIR